MAAPSIQSQGLRAQARLVREALRLMGVAPRELAWPSFLRLLSTMLRLPRWACSFPWSTVC